MCAWAFGEGSAKSGKMHLHVNCACAISTHLNLTFCALLKMVSC